MKVIIHKFGKWIKGKSAFHIVDAEGGIKWAGERFTNKPSQDHIDEIEYACIRFGINVEDVKGLLK
jgi:hypothetical protein